MHRTFVPVVAAGSRCMATSGQRLGLATRISRSVPSAVVLPVQRLPVHATAQPPLWRAGARTMAADAGYEASIEQRLIEALSAQQCKVVDQSGGCGQSFAISVESEAFKGKSRLQRQRMVQEVIREEIAKWHAVTIQTTVPADA
mmetsp:Transcript_4975/g.12091  ORF Transcript_4975/g.12091 Transcript_4975/m.12091 type:complete len:144 (+) Transcript_4975:115-546(+)